MTKEALRRLILEAVDSEFLEEAVKEEIAENLDYEAIAHQIYRSNEQEICDMAAEVLADQFLPF